MGLVLTCRASWFIQQKLVSCSLELLHMSAHIALGWDPVSLKTSHLPGNKSQRTGQHQIILISSSGSQSQLNKQGQCRKHVILNLSSRNLIVCSSCSFVDKCHRGANTVTLCNRVDPKFNH